MIALITFLFWAYVVVFVAFVGLALAGAALIAERDRKRHVIASPTPTPTVRKTAKLPPRNRSGRFQAASATAYEVSP